MKADAQQLLTVRRFWFEFDLRDPARKPQPGQIDGGTMEHTWLWRGTGVTGYDRDDCLELLHELVGADLPPVLREVADVDVDQAAGRIDRGEVPFNLGNP